MPEIFVILSNLSKKLLSFFLSVSAYEPGTRVTDGRAVEIQDS